MCQEAIVSQCAFEFEGCGSEKNRRRRDGLVESVGNGRDIVLMT
jgi:hypothetical protein